MLNADFSLSHTKILGPLATHYALFPLIVMVRDALLSIIFADMMRAEIATVFA